MATTLKDYKGNKLQIEGTSSGGGNQTIINVSGSAKTSLTALALRQLLPSYYTEYKKNPVSWDDANNYLDGFVARVPEGKRFIFFTDSHWDWGMNAKWSPMLCQYVKDMLDIPTVIWGGDYINREDYGYEALQVVAEFGNMLRGAFGSDLLSVFGNHDINCTNLTDENIASIPVAQRILNCNKVYKYLFEFNKSSGNLWDEYGELMTEIAQDNDLTDEEIHTLEYECKMNYYWDDKVNRIRYIVTKCLTGGGYTVLYKLFNEEHRYKYEWIYHVIHDTPEGYDIAYVTHMMDVWTNTGGAMENISNLQAVPIAMLMGRKLCCNKRTYVTKGNENVQRIYNYTSRSFDFTDCPPVGKVFVVLGHVHKDFWSVVNTSPTSATSFSGTPYQGEVLDQNTAGANDNVPIPCISTTCDSFGQSHFYTMEKGTVTEQAFDVFTIQPNAIKITRFGVGSDRVVLFT